MNGAGHLGVVDEANNSFLPTFHEESWSRRYAIISNQVGRLEVGVDLSGELLNLNLIVPDLLSSHWIDDRLVGAVDS